MNGSHHGSAEADPVIRLAARGDGITASGRHVSGAVPGDAVAADGSLLPGPHRVSPACRHFGTCGGCQLQHVSDLMLAQFVGDRVAGALAGQEVLANEIRPAFLSPSGTRRRAALTALLTGRRIQLGFNASASNQIVDLEECPLMLPELANLIGPLRRLIMAHGRQRVPIRVLLQKLDQGVEVVLEGMAGEGLAAAMALQDFAAEHQLARLVIDAGDGPVTLWEPEPATVRLGGIAVVPPPHAFLQATADGEAALIGAVRDAVGPAARIADLFAGIGTFALALAQGRRVYAAEAARDAVGALKSASDRHQVGIVTEHRDLFRRPLIPAEINRFQAVILDPPRAGAEEQVKQLAASSIPTIAYVSCNPASFARDAKRLTASGYRLNWVQPVGQFRWSTHVELVGCFSRA